MNNTNPLTVKGLVVQPLLSAIKPVKHVSNPTSLFSPKPFVLKIFQL